MGLLIGVSGVSIEEACQSPAWRERSRLLAIVIAGAFFAWSGFLAAEPPPPVDVLTYHYDNARTGQNPREIGLTLAKVRPGTFGKLFDYAVDGFVYAQPLILNGVSVPSKSVRNLVFVATEHDSVYAFDADSNLPDGGQPVWHVSFLNPAAGITSVPTSDLGITEPSELGITGTPVIDPASGTLYVVSRTKQLRETGGIYYQHLHALDVATGQEKLGGPVEIQCSAPGFGDDTDGTGHVPFNPLKEFQRPGLVLLKGVVYVTFASAGDVDPYHGWVLGYDAHTLALLQVYNDTPNGGEGGIWMSGSAPAADPQGNLFCLTGNGTWDGTQAQDFGDSFIKLRPSGTNLLVADFFTPFDQAQMAASDGDLGSGGAMVLPDSVGSLQHPHLLVGCGKGGTIYLVDRDNMGQFHAGADSQIVQTLPNIIHGVWGKPAFFNGVIYYQGAGDYLKAFAIANAHIAPTPTSQTTANWGYPNGIPTISANGTNDAIVWVIQTDTFYNDAPAILHAYNATNLAEEIYNSSLTGPQDQPGQAQKFAVPVVANAKVYVQFGSGLSVFGLVGPPVITRQPIGTVTQPGASVTLQVAANSPSPLSYQWEVDGAPIAGATAPSLVLTNLTVDRAGNYSAVVSNRFGAVDTDAAPIVVAVPATLSISANQEVTVTGTPNVTYRVQYVDDLSASASWQSSIDLTLPTDTSMPDVAEATFTDPDPSPRLRYYRAVAVIPTPEGVQLASRATASRGKTVPAAKPSSTR